MFVYCFHLIGFIHSRLKYYHAKLHEISQTFIFYPNASRDAVFTCIVFDRRHVSYAKCALRVISETRYLQRNIRSRALISRILFFDGPRGPGRSETGFLTVRVRNERQTDETRRKKNIINKGTVNPDGRRRTEPRSFKRMPMPTTVREHERVRERERERDV